MNLVGLLPTPFLTVLLNGKRYAKWDCRMKRAKCKHDLSLACKGQLTKGKKSCAKMKAYEVVERGKVAPLPPSFHCGEIKK